MEQLRKRRPKWEFVSECDKIEAGSKWLDIAVIKDWTVGDTDAHVQKFLTELYALAIGKYYIGTPYSAISWLVYFMRSQERDTFELVYKTGEMNLENIHYW